MDVLGVCRVCLARSRPLYRLADTPLEEIYERVTRETLRVDGLPCCVCGVCLSALRRCRRFVEAAHRANIALDRRRRTSRVKVKLTETPLFSLTQSVPEVFEFMSSSPNREPLVKQEIDYLKSEHDDMLQQVQNEDTSHTEDNIFLKEIKFEVTDDFGDDLNENMRGSDDEIDSKQRLNDIQIFKSSVSDSTHSSDEVHVPNSQLPGIYEEEIGVDIKPEMFEDVKFNLEVLHNIKDEPGLGTSHGESDHETLDIDTSVPSLKRVKVTEDTNGPALKRWRHQPGNSRPPAVLHRKGDEFSCPPSQYNPARKHSLQEHFNAIQNAILPFSCDNCDYKCYNKNSLKLHLLTHTGKKLFACDKCEYKGNRKYNFEQHLLTHTGEKPYSCDKCEFKCNQKQHLKQHLPAHTGEKSFACDKCEYKCSHKYSLKLHLLTHTGEMPFSCDKCGYKSINKYSLKRHLLTHTEEKPFSCDKCEFKCKQKYNLKEHLSAHTGEKPFACDKCEYKCNHKSSLKLHLFKHTGEKPFSCDKCEYKCINNKSLKLHLLTHTGEKPFSCDKCDYKCRAKNNLKQHLSTHSGEKPFACDKCEFKCNRQNSLKLHLMTHTGEKRFACDQCEYKCNQKQHLKQHLSTHTGEKLFSCKMCGFIFEKKRFLKKHLLTHIDSKTVLEKKE